METGAGAVAAIRARGESMATSADLKSLQGQWERQPIDEELAGNVVNRVVATVSGLQYTRTYFDQDGKVWQTILAQFELSRCGDLRLITYSNPRYTAGPNAGNEPSASWYCAL
jgi:hypothetical protein